jgi:hypothetical protein
MLNLIPNVKTLNLKEGYLSERAIYYNNINLDQRILKALEKLPYSEQGAKLDIFVQEKGGEGYELEINENGIRINADSSAGAFYAVQTLRQIFEHKEIPYLYIKDNPDFKYRGFYHDVTRGKIPTVATLKSLIDQMAYYKLNSLQLYVEHTCELEEYKDINEKFGYLSQDEIREICDYCKQNFVEFIPSLSTFGHVYELLSQDKYKHLRIFQEEESPNFWFGRMLHYTIDPLNPESIKVIKSLIDQYSQNFESDYFNICCDEPFDIWRYRVKGMDTKKLYIDFVAQIIDHLKQKGKKIMMWADHSLFDKCPERIAELPDDIYFLSYDYAAAPILERIEKLAEMGKTQIVCPSTSTWGRICENTEIEEKNISLMAECGYKHGALGMLNTNWGDWGNPCSLELSMYGLVIGAEKSWSVKTEVDNEFYNRVNFLLYKNENGVQYLKELSEMHRNVFWKAFCHNYFDSRYNSYGTHRDALLFKSFIDRGIYTNCSFDEMLKVQKMYKDFADKLNSEKWVNDEYRQEMLICAEAICVIAELFQKPLGKDFSRVTNTYEWLDKFKKKWLEKNKESELYRIEEMFKYCEEN